jgi:exo-beta-1,3-glucanase (GH17 family)
VRRDLLALHQAGFDGLVTYAANLETGSQPGQLLDIPRLAGEAGFSGMIVGVWDPGSDTELAAAEATGQNPIVAGYSVGNEGLDERYDLATLTAAMSRLRLATGKPVTTTEQAGDYYRSSPLWKVSDWIFPNAHPYFAGIRDPQEAVAWTEQVFTTMSAFSRKYVFFKEVGLPGAGDSGLSEANQAAYYRLLRKTPVNYAVFEAFDAPWKHLGAPDSNGKYPWPDPEPHWGVFTAARQPKPAVSGICSPR